MFQYLAQQLQKEDELFQAETNRMKEEKKKIAEAEYNKRLEIREKEEKEVISFV